MYILFPFENDINYKHGRNGETLTHLAIKSEHFTIIEEILDKRPDLNITDNLGNTPLHGIHAEKNYQTVLEFIIAHKFPFDINKKNYKGDTALSMAIAADCYEQIRTIYENFYDVIDFDSKNNKLETFSHKLASSCNFFKYLKFLESHPRFYEIFNSQINMEDCKKRTPMWMLVKGFQWMELPNYDGILRCVSIENLQKNFHLLINDANGLKKVFDEHPNFFEEGATDILNSSVNHMLKIEAFDFLLTKISRVDLMNVRDESKNILHLLCAKNDFDFLDSVSRFLTTQQLKSLMEQTDDGGKKPIDLLLDETKFLLDFLSPNT